MPIIKKTKKIAKNKIAKKTKKTVARALVKAKTPTKKTKLVKNPVAYFGCMQACCQKGIKPKKIAQVAHECKTNALTINKKIYAEKFKEVKKLGASFNEFKNDLEE